MIAYLTHLRYSTRVSLPGYFAIMIVKYENKRVRNTNFIINYRPYVENVCRFVKKYTSTWWVSWLKNAPINTLIGSRAFFYQLEKSMYITG